MADGNITVEVSTEAAQAELARLRAENTTEARPAVRQGRLDEGPHPDARRQRTLAGRAAVD